MSRCAACNGSFYLDWDRAAVCLQCGRPAVKLDPLPLISSWTRERRFNREPAPGGIRSMAGKKPIPVQLPSVTTMRDAMRRARQG